MEGQLDGSNTICVLATFNLPCFFKHMQNWSLRDMMEQHDPSPNRRNIALGKKDSDIPMEILKRALKMCNSNHPKIARKILAASIHELFDLKPNHTYVQTLLKILQKLIETAETEVDLIGILCNNLSKILANFLSNINLDDYLMSLA